MEADMYNLHPEIGEVNELRGDKNMGEVGESPTEGAGRLSLAMTADTFQPRPEVRGDVARAYLYMDAAYAGS
jgi:deoxyribonuclease-1